jgi:predicted 3-demethylubiquinone-9 3-methyltransferase (glyoxalase superfamily)
MQNIMPCLWFDNNAEEAVSFYLSIFKDAKILGMTRYGDAGPGPKGSVMTVSFELRGQEYLGLNGGPRFKFSEAVSFIVKCGTQEEIDEMWERLSEGGAKSRCGWLKDKFGLSWQIVPSFIGEMMLDQDPEKVNRVMKAVLQMDKLDIKRMKQAYEQG